MLDALDRPLLALGYYWRRLFPLSHPALLRAVRRERLRNANLRARLDRAEVEKEQMARAIVALQDWTAVVSHAAGAAAEAIGMPVRHETEAPRPRVAQ